MTKTFKLNPFLLIILWLGLSLIITMAEILILASSTPGGGQRPLSFLGQMIPIAMYGLFFVAVLTVPLYIAWIKKYWFVNLIFIVISCLFIYLDQTERSKRISKYPEIFEEVNAGGKIFEKRTEYYDKIFSRIRSISFSSDNKPDSIWPTFGENGEIIKPEKYNEGKLFEVMK